MARLLIVEDEPTDRVILANIVEGTGHEVFFASDGEQALRVHLKKSIDVVITDLQMPQVNGLGFIASLREAHPEAAIIVVSGMGREFLAEVRSRGALVVLSKPVDPHELLDAIASAAPD